MGRRAPVTVKAPLAQMPVEYRRKVSRVELAPCDRLDELLGLIHREDEVSNVGEAFSPNAPGGQESCLGDGASARAS
jgi:hypothetical protein